MTKRQLMFGLFTGFVLIAITSVLCYFYLEYHKIDAEINAQKDIKRIEIEEKEATIRTKERMQWIPWYSDK